VPEKTGTGFSRSVMSLDDPRDVGMPNSFDDSSHQRLMVLVKVISSDCTRRIHRARMVERMWCMEGDCIQSSLSHAPSHTQAGM
jgi:hypothetical protein